MIPKYLDFWVTSYYDLLTDHLQMDDGCVQRDSAYIIVDIRLGELIKCMSQFFPIE